MSLAFRERPEFKLGRSVELMVADWLRQFGFYIIPSYDYSGDERNKAPKLQGLNQGFPVPDLDIAKSGSRKWVEVKAKTKADWTRKTGRYEHGIEHYDDYLQVQQETGTEVWLAIYETETNCLLMQSLNLLGEPRRSTMNGRRMAYWPRDAFRPLTDFKPSQVTA